jgi:plastocyanin
MRRLSVLALPVLAAALVACSSSATPGWTYAPAPSTTPIPSGSASGSPGASEAASAAPSGSPAASAPTPGPSAAESGPPPSGPAGGSPAASPGATTLTITAPVGAATAGFDPTTLTAPANAPFTIHFNNEDNQAPHNVALTDSAGAAVTLGGDTQFFQGPGTRDYAVPALQAGTYNYMCQVHPTTMKGVLTVQ